MPTKGEKQRKNDNKGKNPKTANPVTMQTDTNMEKPVRGVPEI